jgi:hypothetical protein
VPIFADETAWGFGDCDFDRSWGTFFQYCPTFGPTVTEGQLTFTKAAGVRFKGQNSGGEIYLGPMTSSSATPRVETNYPDFTAAVQKTYQVTFSHSATDNSISTAISSPDASLVFDFDTQGAPDCDPTGWDAMEIFVRDSRTDSGVALQNVVLEGNILGEFGTVDKLGTPGGQYWGVTGFDFSQDFTVTADFVVDGFTGNESIKVEFNVGCLP